jgi:RecB family exonuclease
MAAGVVRLVVAADAAARLGAARAWLDALPPDAPALVLAPSWEACDDLAREVAEAGGARLGLVRLTLHRLAMRLAARALAERGLTPSSPLALAAVVTRAVDRLARARALGRFAAVAGHPGLPVALGRTLDELRLAGLDLRALAAVGPGGTDLAVVAETVATELAADGLADAALMLETARTIATGADPPAPVGLPLCLLDLPLTHALEVSLVSALAGRAPAVLATAVAGDLRSREALRSALGPRAEIVEPPAAAPGALGRLQRHLFEDSTPKPAAVDDRVRLAAWPGEARECVEIARAIQAEASRGVPFDRMAVALHAPAEYAAHLEEAFARADIPAFFARGTARPHPAGRALLALLACKAEGLSARGFAEYLSLAQVPDPDGERVAAWAPPENDLLPDAPVPPPPDPTPPLVDDPEGVAAVAGTLHAPRRWEQLLVEAAVIGGVERWSRRLDGLEADLRARRAALADEEPRALAVERDLRDLGHLRAFALPLVARLARLPERASWGTWLEALRALAGHALREPEAVLATLAELEPMATVGPVDLDEVRLVLGPRLRDLTAVPPRRRYGRVFVAPTAALRGLVFDVVLVPGLAENVFPGRIVEDPILLDVERMALAAGLETQVERTQAERLALRLAVGAARERVHLSYPRVDVEKARPRVPSFYALEVLRAAEGRLPGFDELGRRAERAAQARLGWPAPERPEDAIDEAEYDLALLAPLLDADPETTAGTASYLLGANPHLARALRARARRWIRRWTPADGLVDPDPLARAALAAHQLEARAFSATALQHFAVCPYKFFLYTIQRLEPRDEPARVEVDPLTRGSLTHDVQFRVLSRLRDDGRLPLRPEDLPAAYRILDDVLDEEARRAAEQVAPAIPRVWDDGVDAIRADLHEWLRRHAEAPDGWVPWRFELSFDVADRDRAHADPASVGQAVEVLGRLRLRGAIDLVERDAVGRLRVTDHKTGRATARAGVVVGGGQVLQPVLYALAAERLLEAEVAAGRLYYCTGVGGYEERVVPLDPTSRAHATAVIDTVAQALEQGFLPAAPAEPQTCAWCDYRPVCGPYEWIRVQRKPAARLAALARLRELP